MNQPEPDPSDASRDVEPGTAADNSPLRLVEGVLERPKISLLYRFSFALIALAMVLLPCIYAGLLIFLGCEIWYHAAHFNAVFERTGFLSLIGFSGLLFLGVVLTLSLIKPIFAPRQKRDEPISLNHADAPQLFAFIGWVCRSLEAPIPSRIDVNLTANAGAGFRSGLRSIFGNDIILVIGLPLVAGLNLSQFAGVIAHEYGHFSQGAALRAHYLITRINGWFYRAVHERDAWDAVLVAAADRENHQPFVVLLAETAQFFTWIGRGVLSVFMVAGQALSCVLERQMEFDADGYEIKMSGTETFLDTTRRLQQLNLGLEAAQRRLLAKWKTDRKLFDQFPEFVVSCANDISAEAQGRHLSRTLKRKTNLFDTHPSDAERAQRAVAAREPGIFHGKSIATSLFADFAGLSRRATLGHYRNLIGPDFSTDWLVSTEDAAHEAEHDAATDEQIVRRYLGGVEISLRPIIVIENKSHAVRSRETLIADIRKHRARMEELLSDARETLSAFARADHCFLQATRASQLLQAGFTFDPLDLDLPDSDVETRLNQAQRIFEKSGTQLKEFEDSARERLTAAIQLYRQPDATVPLATPAALQDKPREMIWALARLGEVFPPLLEIRRDCAVLEILLQHRNAGESADNLSASLEKLRFDIQERVKQVQQMTAQIRHPFQSATEQVFVNEYARNKEYHPDPCELVLREGSSHVEKLTALYYRLLGALVVIAEQVEQGLVQK